MKASTTRRVHGILAIVWLALCLPSGLFWRNSLTYVVAISVYNIVITHAAAWQASRSEQASE